MAYICLIKQIFLNKNNIIIFRQSTIADIRHKKICFSHFEKSHFYIAP